MAHFRHFMKAHRAIYEWSGGRIGSRLLGIDMVLMYTVGRKSGRVHAAPVACYRMDDQGVWVHATNNGLDAPPAWWLNLQAHPEIDIRLGRDRYRVRAEETHDPATYARVWSHMTRIQPRVAAYPQQTARHIPVVLLRFLHRYD